MNRLWHRLTTMNLRRRLTPENIAHHNWAIDVLLDARHQAMTQDAEQPGLMREYMINAKAFAKHMAIMAAMNNSKPRQK